MMSPSFALHLQPLAAEQYRDLDTEVRRRIREKLLWLADHAEAIRHLPLRRDLAGMYKRRVGDYRILYQVVSAERAIVVHAIGHRREIYLGS